MESYAYYLLKSAAWITGFSLIFFLFLRNERFFRIKRFYLVTGILASFLFPLISFHYSIELPGPQVSAQDLITAQSQTMVTGQQDSAGNQFNYRFALLFLYLIGILLLSLRMIRHISVLSGIIKRTKTNDLGSVKLIKTSGFPSAFSFFNYVFINPSVNENEAKEILNHESVHILQKHWFDLLLAEFLRIIQWVNPFAWIYADFIRQNHEYLADEAALQHTVSPANYKAALINQLFGSPVISLSNSFNCLTHSGQTKWRKQVFVFALKKFLNFLRAFDISGEKQLNGR